MIYKVKIDDEVFEVEITELHTRPIVAKVTTDIPGYHSSPVDAARSASAAGVRHLLLYHVVPNQRITAKKALKANGAKLETAQGGTITVKVRHSTVTLKDNDPDLRNPRVVQVDINKGNKQIAHGIDRVLLPINV